MFPTAFEMMWHPQSGGAACPEQDNQIKREAISEEAPQKTPDRSRLL
jgi:hypothetical protein